MRIKLLVGSLLLALVVLALPAPSFAGVIFSVVIAPPPLPVYEQPFCPGEGYIWTPGYWAYSDDGGYFWVPGTWVLVPEPGFLWTPAWWGWSDGFFVFHEGYWGPHVGFYGGINYGFGYGGFGYEGGYWRNGAFFYNRSVNNVRNVTNVYNKTVIINNNVRSVSYNGGEGGINARPTTEQEEAARERHIRPTSVQAQHVERASTNRQLFESYNHGRPSIAATPRPTEFGGREAVKARAAGPSYRPPTARSASPGGASPGGGGGPRPETRNAIHPNQLPQIQRPSPNTGNPRLDQRYQQGQEKIRAKQEQERQNLQRKQDQEHQRLEQRRASDPERQRVEQRHQQQTQQLEQRHTQQQQKFEQKPRR
jgi:hypothetical protein